jgi:phage gp29-like protein
MLTQALKRLPMIDVFQHLLTANRYGYAGLEIDWGIIEIEGRKWVVPTWFTPVEARRFRIGPDQRLRLFADVSRPLGDELVPGKWLMLQRPGRVARAGLMRSGAFPAMGKRLGWRDWLVFSQRFGIPLVLARYTPGETDDDVLAVAEEIVQKIGSDGGAAIPDDIKVEIVESRTSNPNDKTHGGLIAHCNAELAKLIVGSTLTNDNAGSGGASYALGEVHATVRWDNVTFDAAKLQEAFRTQVCVPFMLFNNLTGSAPLLEIQVVRDLDPTAIIQMADTLTNKLGIPVSQSQMRQVAGFKAPTTGDEAPGAPKALPAPAPAPAVKEAA